MLEKQNILVVGPVGVGKTSLIRRYQNAFFSPNAKPTIGMSYTDSVDVGIIDIAGDQIYGSNLALYQRNVSVVIFCVAIDAVEESITYLQDFPLARDVPLILALTKVDKSDASDFGFIRSRVCKIRSFDSFFETSARQNKHVSSLFQAAEALIVPPSSDSSDDVHVIGYGSVNQSNPRLFTLSGKKPSFWQKCTACFTSCCTRSKADDEYALMEYPLGL